MELMRFCGRTRNGGETSEVLGRQRTLTKKRFSPVHLYTLNSGLSVNRKDWPTTRNHSNKTLKWFNYQLETMTREEERMVALTNECFLNSCVNRVVPTGTRVSGEVGAVHTLLLSTRNA